MILNMSQYRAVPIITITRKRRYLFIIHVTWYRHAGAGGLGPAAATPHRAFHRPGVHHGGGRRRRDGRPRGGGGERRHVRLGRYPRQERQGGEPSHIHRQAKIKDTFNTTI